ncbi:hypothetical protein MNBD_NITROSPINAE04-281 [hydrothermal vent metagenome]|uniref:Membrane transport protein MMPL domain-containing protein n=1 Tax=hydrothermal vent metagenome TaxID=652676 RepID=A0A3B1BAE2_9ZZZZ
MKLKPVTVIIAWLAIISCAGALLFSSVRLVSDLTFFLGGDNDAGNNSIIEDLRSGANGRIIILGLEGASTIKLAKASGKLAEALRQTGRFEYILNGTSSGHEYNLDKLFKWRYLLSPNMKEGRFEPKQLRSELVDRLDELSSLTGVFTGKYLESDPTAEFRAIVKNMSGNIERATKHGVWFSPDGNRALMLLSSKASAFNIDEQEKLIGLIKRTFKETNPLGEIKLGLTGSGIFSVESRAFIKAEAQRITVLASGVVIVFLLVVFRSFIAVVLSALPLLTGIVFAVAATQLLCGYVHGITIAFGATIIGVAVDYPIHVMSHKMKGEKAQATVERIGSTLIIGAFTTSIGYAAMVFSGFAGLNQLGVFSIAGTLAAAISARYILPMAVADDFFLSDPVSSAPMISFFANRARLITPILILFAIFSAISLVFDGMPVWDDNLSKLNVVSESGRRLDEKLRAELNAPDALRFITVKGASVEGVLQKSEALTVRLDELVEQGALGGYDMAAKYLPSINTQRLRQKSIPDKEVLRKNLSAAVSGLIFKKDTFEPFIRDVIDASSSKFANLENMRGTPIGLKLSLLLKKVDGKSIALIPLYRVQNENDLIELAKSTGKHGVRYINIKSESTNLIKEYRSEAVTACILGLFAIIVALFVFLDSIRDIGRILISVAGPIAIVMFILSRLEGGLSIFHLVSILLVAGLGIDYALFLNRDFPTQEERNRTLSSALICNISTILVFGILAMSELYVLSSIGSTVFLGAALSLVFSLATRKDLTSIRNAK